MSAIAFYELRLVRLTTIGDYAYARMTQAGECQDAMNGYEFVVYCEYVPIPEAKTDVCHFNWSPWHRYVCSPACAATMNRMTPIRR